MKSITGQIFEPFGLKPVLKPQENRIEVLKYQEDVLISYPYSVVSDTLRRIIFYLMAIKSNRDSILVFEEPEAHVFPFYTKFLAERVALDEGNNQYFISTHNPYFLLSLIEKAPQRDLAVFLTYYEDYQTRVRPLREKDKEEVLDQELDAFFNLGGFLGADR